MAETRKDLEQVTEALGPMLDRLTEKLPGLLRAVLTTMYAEETARDLGRAVGSFYQEVREAGIPEDEAAQMARVYLKSLQDVFREGMTVKTNH